MAASLKLILTDAFGNDLNDHITVDLFSQQSSRQYQAIAAIGRELTIDGIDVSTSPVYRVMVSPANHRVMQFFVMLTDGTTTEHAEMVPVDPQKVVSIAGPDYTDLPVPGQKILDNAQIPRFNDGAGGFLQGARLYTGLDQYPLLKACLLNIIAKSKATGLADGQTCLDHYTGLVRLEQDRLFVLTTGALVEETAQSNSFHEVPATLHEPMPGYQIGRSYKTFDSYGNLQLTFQRRVDDPSGWAADVDIDDAQGIAHVFQVLRNLVTGATNPYDIHEILLQQQPPVDPRFRFVFAAAMRA